MKSIDWKKGYKLFDNTFKEPASVYFGKVMNFMHDEECFFYSFDTNLTRKISLLLQCFFEYKNELLRLILFHAFRSWKNTFILKSI